MAITKRQIENSANLGSKDYNDFIMEVENHRDVEKILIYMVDNKLKERAHRTFCRFSYLRRQFEREMISNLNWRK